jgi:hypothetical protein
MRSQSAPIKTDKEVKAEVLALLGTLKEKLDFVRKCNEKYLLTVFNSLYKDPHFKDASGVAEFRIYQVLLERTDCPQEIVLACLSMPWFEGQDYVYRSKFIPQEIVDAACTKAVKEVTSSWNLTQVQLNLLTSILHSPNLSRKMRLKVENLSDKLSEKYIDDSLISVAVKFTKRQAWLNKKYSDFLQGGIENKTFIKNIVTNPLCKPFMVDYACRLCISADVAAQLIRHPNISIQGLEVLRSKFSNLREFINQIIERHLDPED